MASTPSAPDPYKTAAAQGAANKEAAIYGSILNNPNQITPYGNVIYKQYGSERVQVTNEKGRKEWIDVPRYTQEVHLSGDQKKLLKLQNAASTNLGTLAVTQTNKLQNLLSKPVNDKGLGQYKTDINRPTLQQNIDLNGVNASPTALPGSNNYEAARKSVEDATFSRYNTDYGDRRQQLQSELASRGLMEGSAAWNKALDELNRERTDAKYQAVLAGGQEQTRMANLDLQSAQYKLQRGQALNSQELAAMEASNAAKQQDYSNRMSSAEQQNAVRSAALQERLALRNQPINEISALMSGSQVNLPQVNPLYRQGVEPAPVADSVYKSYQMEAANSQAGMSGLFGLGSSLISGLGSMFKLSDEREKEDVEKIGETPGGHNVYSYRYKDGVPRGASLFDLADGEHKSVGVMAQEVEKKIPGAVKTFGGRKHVNYGMVH